MRLPITLFLLTSSLILSACGQRGPLYLPDPPPQQSPAENTQ